MVEPAESYASEHLLAILADMKSPPRLPTAERQRQIAAAALRIISTQGVRRLTAAALADEVGIADGTIFRHFKNKEAIVSAAIDLFESTLDATFPPPIDEPLERLGVFVVNRLTLVRKNPLLLRLAFNERLAEAAGPTGAARVEQLVQRSMAFIRDCLEQAQQRGQVTSDTPLTLLVWMVIGVVRGAATHAAHGVHNEDPLSSASADQVWHALESFLRTTAQESSR